MNFNISVCYLNIGKEKEAIECAENMVFYSNDLFYEGWQKYKRVLKGKYNSSNSMILLDTNYEDKIKL
jgi:hypothetical protein